jgi:hypothetical protein
MVSKYRSPNKRQGRVSRFNRDLAKLTDAIEAADGDTLFDLFTRTRAIRRGIVAVGQDSEAPDFGRPRPALHASLPLPYASEESSINRFFFACGGRSRVFSGLAGCSRNILAQPIPLQTAARGLRGDVSPLDRTAVLSYFRVVRAGPRHAPWGHRVIGKQVAGRPVRCTAPWFPARRVLPRR